MSLSGWFLPTLTEFFPSNPNLLGMNQNRGETIFIRLRPADDKSSFLPLEEHLVGTLLHEFTHNVHGPHHKQFYEFLDKLQDEYDVLRTSGYTGEGFFSEGKRAGSTRDLPPHLAREKALQGAQRRQQINSIMGAAGGNRLGPGRSNIGKTPRQMAAESAERRALDDKACGHGTNVSGLSVEEEMEKAKQESTTLSDASTSSNSTTSMSTRIHPVGDKGDDGNEDDDSDIEIVVPANANKANQANSPNNLSAKQASIRKRTASRTVAETSRPLKSRKEEPQSWICSACTYENDNLLGLACEICGTERQTGTQSYSQRTTGRKAAEPVLSRSLPKLSPDSTGVW